MSPGTGSIVPLVPLEVSPSVLFELFKSPPVSFVLLDPVELLSPPPEASVWLDSFETPGVVSFVVLESPAVPFVLFEPSPLPVSLFVLLVLFVVFVSTTV